MWWRLGVSTFKICPPIHLKHSWSFFKPLTCSLRPFVPLSIKYSQWKKLLFSLHAVTPLLAFNPFPLLSTGTVQFSAHVFIKNINIQKLNGSGIEKVSLTFLAASPQTASKQLFLNHCPRGEGDDYAEQKKILLFCTKLLWKIWCGSFFKADSTPFQLAHFWLRRQNSDDWSSLSSSLSPPHCPKEPFKIFR